MLRIPWRGRPRTEGAPGTVGIVLQATGSHAWAVSRGWERAAGELGVLGAVLSPRARWEAASLDDDGGLAAYLGRTRPDDLVLLMGFDWHSQVLHRSSRWRKRITRARARKILYVQESIASSVRLSGSDAMAQAFRSAVELCDGVLYADVADRGFIEAAGKPSMWQPFGVDVGLFRAEVPFAERAPRAFFRGKLDAFGNELEYSDRRRFIAHLRARDLVEVIPYTPGDVQLARLVEDFNRFRIALNLPSVFAGHPTRVLEGMACGCCVVTNRTGVPEVDELFQEGVELVYYQDETELAGAVLRLSADVAVAGAIAGRGRQAVMERFSLTRLLAEVMEWAARSFGTVLGGAPGGPPAERPPRQGSRSRWSARAWKDD